MKGISKLTAEIGVDEAQIFEIHAMLLEDEDFLESVESCIDGGFSAEEAVKKSAEKFYLQLRSLGDEYLSARASDIKDISGGIISTDFTDLVVTKIYITSNLTDEFTAKLTDVFGGKIVVNKINSKFYPI